MIDDSLEQEIKLYDFKFYFQPYQIVWQNIIIMIIHTLQKKLY